MEMPKGCFGDFFLLVLVRFTLCFGVVVTVDFEHILHVSRMIRKTIFC